MYNVFSLGEVAEPKLKLNTKQKIIKNFALKNHLSVGRRLKNRNEVAALVGVMTSEAHSPLGKGSSLRFRLEDNSENKTEK